MKHLRQLSLFLGMLLASGIVMAGGASEGSINNLMELSGLNKQIDEIPGGIAGGIKAGLQKGAQLSEEQYAQVEKAAFQSFQPEKISAAISSQLKHTLSEAETQKLLKWYRSDLGKKITQAEAQASEPAAYQAMVNQAKSLLADKERVNMALRIDKLVNASEMSLEFQKSTATAVYTSIVKANQPDQPVDMAPFKAQLAKDEAKLMQQVKQFVVLSFVYTYKDIADADMEQYMDFLARPETRKFNDNAISTMQEVLSESVKSMGEPLGKIFTAQR
jgi:hypothetical protein